MSRDFFRHGKTECLFLPTDIVRLNPAEKCADIFVSFLHFNIKTIFDIWIAECIDINRKFHDCPRRTIFQTGMQPILPPCQVIFYRKFLISTIQYQGMFAGCSGITDQMEIAFEINLQFIPSIGFTVFDNLCRRINNSIFSECIQCKKSSQN